MDKFFVTVKKKNHLNRWVITDRKQCKTHEKAMSSFFSSVMQHANRSVLRAEPFSVSVIDDHKVQ